MTMHKERPSAGVEKKLRPIKETERTVAFLGVQLEKAQHSENAPRMEQFRDYIDDAFSLDTG